MDSMNLDQVFEDAKLDIEHKLNKFRAELNEGTSDPDKFMSLADIERKWTELKNETSKTYSDIVSAYLSNIDERGLIKSKKENTRKRG